MGIGQSQPRSQRLSRRALAIAHAMVEQFSVSGLGLPLPRQLVGMAAVIVIALSGCGPPSNSQGAEPADSAAEPTKFGASPTPSGPSATSSAAMGFGDLPPGDAAEIDCGERGPVFSPSGELLACRRQLLDWPTMETLADLQGLPLSWGELDGKESLLIEFSQGMFGTLDVTGTHHTIDTEGLEGRVIAEWGPTGDAVWLQSGIQTATLRLDSWTPPGREELVSVADTITATNITASLDARWAAIFRGGCSTSGCAFSVDIIDVASSIATSVAVSMPGTLADVWVTANGEVLFTVDRGAGGFDLWRARQGEALSIWLAGVSVFPLADNRLALAGANDAVTIDLATGNEEPLELPSGAEASELLSVSPDSEWIAIRTDESSVVFMPRLDGDARSVEVPVPSPVTVHWTGDSDYALLALGPPFTTMVVRLAD